MNKFRPIQYLKKYTFLIIALFVFLTLGMYMVLRSLQTYTATTIIDYVYGMPKMDLLRMGLSWIRQVYIHRV